MAAIMVTSTGHRGWSLNLHRGDSPSEFPGIPVVPAAEWIPGCRSFAGVAALDATVWRRGQPGVVSSFVEIATGGTVNLRYRTLTDAFADA